MDTPIGEMLDMMSCFLIAEGFATEVSPAMDYDDVMRLE